MNIEQYIPKELRNEYGQIGGLTALTIGVATVGIVVVVVLYVMEKLATNLNDSDVSSVVDNIVTGFKDSATFIPLVLTFGLIGAILAILVALGRQG